MNRIVLHTFHMVALMAFFAGGLKATTTQIFAATDPSNQPVHAEASSGAGPENLSGLALLYAEAMAAGRVEEWAALDLGCLARQQEQGGLPNKPLSASTAQTCWDDTMAAHRKLVADEAEPAIFGALGRGTGFGLIHESHQHADFWKDYPPALSVSPTVVRPNYAISGPLMQVEKVLDPRSVGLVIGQGQAILGVQEVRVDISVTYPDLLTAPLALLPGEPWWASPVIRRYGPVYKLIARFTVVSGLRALGFPVDQAVVNEALTGSPLVAGPSVPGILPASPLWWNRDTNPQQFEAIFQEARQETLLQEKVKKFKRLLLLDPEEPRVNAVFGTDLYVEFLREGLAIGKITSNDGAIKPKLAELYWNIQAQTWRQEFTEVSVGHSFAADMFYRAMPALEIALKGGQSNSEMRRRLGALYRWNNDTASALTLHEGLLKDVSAGDHLGRARLLSEITWDRVQWLSWNRRYDHPWMLQAREEAEQALSLAMSPIDKLIAGEALVILDALAVPPDQSRLAKHVEVIRTQHDQLSGVVGMWSHLIGNDLVKALIPEGLHVTLPTSARSPEVMHNEVHLRIQDLNFLTTWGFDQGPVGGLPSGFSAGSTREGSIGGWRIEADLKAPSLPHVITQASPCAGDACFQVLLGARRTHELPDIVVYLHQVSSSDQGEAGIVLAAKDPRNFYAVTMNPTTKQLSIYRIQNGEPTLLGTGEIKIKPGPWHVLRVQTVNSAHVDHPRLEIYVDGYETRVMASEPIQGGGRIGLVTKGDMVAQFDRLRVIEMVTSRPMSKPAAY